MTDASRLTRLSPSLWWYRDTCNVYLWAAGDRGLLHPELPLAATRDEAGELAGRTFDAAFCSNRTCEIGLEQGTGRTYESFVFALEKLTRP